MAQLVVFGVVTWAVGSALGARIRVIAFGAPPLLRVRAANPEVRIGPFPSGSVDLTGDDDSAYRRLARWRRVAIALAPWLVVLGIAMACLGLMPALRTFARGFVQFVIVVDVTPLVRKMVDIANAAPLHITAGILFAKLAAMNLLPFGGLAGAATIRELVTPRNGSVPGWVNRYILLTMTLFMLWMLGRFGWALIQLAR